MKLFGRKPRQTAQEPVERGSCSCPEHIEELADLRIPLNRDVRDEIDADAQTVADLLESGGLGIDLCIEQWLYDPDTGHDDDGPYQWSIWYGDEARSSYDDEAPLPLDEALLSRPGVERVAWEDREVVHLGTSTLCRDGVLAAAARALADPGVRLPEE